jgi:hypothetical protein
MTNWERGSPSVEGAAPVLAASRVFTLEEFPGAAVKMPKQIAIKISVDAIVLLIKFMFEARMIARSLTQNRSNLIWIR